MPEDFQQAAEIARWMSAQDRFARHLGIELKEATPGYCRVELTVTEEMLNAVGLTHGGVTFTLADFAFAVASNTHGRVAVALTAQINYPGASRAGDLLVAEATERLVTERTGYYNIEVKTSDQQLVGIFNGTVFRRSDNLSDWINGEIT